MCCHGVMAPMHRHTHAPPRVRHAGGRNCARRIASRRCKTGADLALPALRLDLIPKRIHLSQIAVGGGLTHGGQLGFDPFETTGEFRVGSAQGGFGIKSEVTAQIGHHEQQIAELLFDFCLRETIARLDQLGSLFGDFVQDFIGGGPVKSDPCGAFLQLERAQQRGQANGHTIQRALLRVFCTFAGLYLFPIGGLLVR